MNIKIGANYFNNVSIPILWGERAILQDQEGRLSVVDLRSGNPRLEILGDTPAQDITYLPTEAGFEIREGEEAIYTYDPNEKILSVTSSGGLPDIQVSSTGIRVGTNHFLGNVVSGSAVGIAVSPSGVSLGAEIPPSLVGSIDLDSMES